MMLSAVLIETDVQREALARVPLEEFQTAPKKRENKCNAN